MLSKPHVIKALEAKRDAFDHFELRASQQLQRYLEALTRLSQQSQEEVGELLRGIDNPGARPTAERLAGRPIVLPFEPRWANHQEARAWAMTVLRGVPTMAVDGSQITPSRDFSIPVGAVQVAWYENTHDVDGHYVKDLRFEVLSPDDLTDEDAETGPFPDLQVNLRRFELECEALTDYMRRMSAHEPPPVCFFDGSLVISFAAQMRPGLQRRYVNAVRNMLIASESTHVPLVGYVDTSYARDLVSMLRWLGQDASRPSISDGALLRHRMGWGDRTEAFVCARDDKLFRRPGEGLNYYARVLFSYLKTTSDNPPARLDLPAWLLGAGLLDWVVDIVRAECIVGTGYPYAVETADAVAVITARDRDRFYRTLQEYVESLGLELRYSRKAYSKRGRR